MLLIRDTYRHRGASRAKQRSPWVNGGAQMAEAFIEERQLLKSLRWWDGFVIALCNPGFLVASLGFSMGALGTWGAVFLWAVSAAVGMLQSWIYAESASMFPDKPGGISLYAHEGWRGRFSLVGPVGAFGYWIGWSVVLSIFGKVIGDLIFTKWFPTATWSWSDGVVNVGLPHVIAIGCIIIVWLLNIFGIRPAVWISYITGAGLMIPLVIVIFGSYISGSWHSTNMTWELHGFSGFQTLLVYLLFPLGLGGVTGAPSAATAEGEFYVPAFAKIVGSGAASVMLVLLIGSLFLSMISSTADGSRALYGIARDDMTIKQLFHLNRFHVPARAMTVDLAVNVLLVLFISSNLTILYMSNIGYMLSHVFALSGFLLLRRDRPNWPRPIKVGPIWVGIAAVLCVFDAVLVGFGIAKPSLTGYGTYADMFIGVGVLVGSVVLFFYRRIVQDKQRVTFREEVPSEPSPEQMALLRDEAVVVD